jgi:hypothetical protein
MKFSRLRGEYYFFGKNVNFLDTKICPDTSILVTSFMERREYNCVLRSSSFVFNWHVIVYVG